MKNTRFLVTGGHMTPALAVISELKKAGYTDFVWVGHKYNQVGASDTSPEFKTVQKLNIPFVDLRSGKLVRSWYRSPADFSLAVINLLRIPWGFLKSGFIVLRYRPQVVVSFGGYLALPIVVWGRLLGCKVLTHEQTVITGVANKLIGYFAHVVCISWQSSAKYYPARKVVFTGNPIRKEVFEIKSDSIHFNNDLPIVYITGGNQGSYRINQTVFAALSELLQFANVVHQTGEAQATLEELQRLSLASELQTRYMHQPYFYGDSIGEVLAKSTLVISRGGANTVTELLALGLPAVIIPIPWATGNEQFLNGKMLADSGLGLVVEEKNLDGTTLVSTVRTLLAQVKAHQGTNGQPLDQVKSQAQSLVKLAAEKIIVEKLQGLINGA